MAVPPQHVVRFYGNTDYAIQSIGFREITFLHRDKLNDPFDPHFFFTTDFSDSYTALIDRVEQYHRKDLQNFKDRLPQENWKQFVDGIEGYFNSLRNNTFLFSTSAINKDRHPKDNLYMWSHYGNGHRGLAIEFDTALLARGVLAGSKRLAGEETYLNEVWSEINYTATLPKITCESIFQFVINDSEKPDEVAREETDLAKLIQLMLRSKSIEWKTEDEWRLMWLNKMMKQNSKPRDVIYSMALLPPYI